MLIVLKKIEEPFKVYNVTRKIKLFGDYMHQNKLLDEIDIDTTINDFASRNVRRNF
jgi:hypothetical protein